MPLVGFEHTTPVFKRAKTVHALDCTLRSLWSTMQCITLLIFNTLHQYTLTHPFTDISFVSAGLHSALWRNVWTLVLSVRKTLQRSQGLIAAIWPVYGFTCLVSMYLKIPVILDGFCLLSSYFSYVAAHVNICEYLTERHALVTICNCSENSLIPLISMTVVGIATGYRLERQRDRGSSPGPVLLHII
jgi:hypothetical protein